jgi:hypothetical protein
VGRDYRATVFFGTDAGRQESEPTMKRTIWKQICLVLPFGLMAAEWDAGHTARGQSRETSSNIATVSTSEEEALFDTQLLSQSSAYAVTSPLPNCIDTVAPPPQQLPSPDAVFAPPASQGFEPPSQGFLPAGQGALTAQNSVAASLMPGGYLDPAAPVTMFRLRYDTAVNNRFPDRGEYFYAKCGCFRDPALAGAMLDPNAQGPAGANTSVNYQEIRPYFEYAFNPRISIFTELPVRFVSFNSIPGTGGLGDTGGFSDMNAGFKYALIAEQDRYLTYQFRAYFPTGDAGQGLGTDHVSLESSLLYYRRLSNKWLLQGQFTSFNPIDGSEFASDVLQYGGGLGYLLHQSESVTVIPTVEMVGWTFLNGQKFNPIDGQSSASGDTIINVKPGVRVGFGRAPGPMMMQQQSIYAGFGIPVTDEQFYSNLFRVEYRFVF